MIHFINALENHIELFPNVPAKPQGDRIISKQPKI